MANGESPSSLRLVFAIREGWDSIFHEALLRDEQRFGAQHVASHFDAAASIEIEDHSHYAYGGARALIEDAAFGAIVLYGKKCGDEQPRRLVAVADKSSLYWHLESKVALGRWSSSMPHEHAVCPRTLVFSWDHDVWHDQHLAAQFDTDAAAAAADHTSRRARAWVLKRDGASGAVDVHFVTSVSEIADHVERDQEMQEALPMLDERSESIAGWALQAFVSNPLLLPIPDFSMPEWNEPAIAHDECSGAPTLHKLHIRTFVVVVRGRVFLYDRYEVRFAEAPYNHDVRDREAQVTNGGGRVHNRRILADLLLDTLRAWAARLPHERAAHSEAIAALARSFAAIPEFMQRVMLPLPSSADDTEQQQHELTLCRSLHQEQYDDTAASCHHPWHHFALLAHDLLPDETGRLWLLETNHCPGAPPLPTKAEAALDRGAATFREHLLVLAQQLTLLLVSGRQDTAQAYHFVELSTTTPTSQ